MHPLATLFAAWFHHLGALAWARGGRSHADQPAWLLLNNYLVRTRLRLLRLIALWQANALPPPRPRAGRSRKAPATPAPRPPRARAWMLKRAGHHAAAHAAQLQHLLEQPESRNFLAEVPRAARLLRPLAHLLGLRPLPAPLARPPRRRPAPKPRPPRAPSPAAQPAALHPRRRPRAQANHPPRARAKRAPAVITPSSPSPAAPAANS